MDYVFALRVDANQVDAERRMLCEMAADVQTYLPGAEQVLITSYLGLSLLDSAGQPLDLHALPWSIAERLVDFFGYGFWVLPGASLPASSIFGTKK